MSISNSLLQDLLADFPEIRSQIYFKSSLVALARAMEDLIPVSYTHLRAHETF